MPITDDDSTYQPRRVVAPAPPAYVPHASDPLEAALIAQAQARGERHPGEIIEEQP